MNGYRLGHPTLNANVRATARALSDAGLLEELHTTLDTTSFSRLPGPLRDQLAKRALDPAVHARTVAHPVREVLRLGTRRWLRDSSSPFSVDRQYRTIDRAVARSLAGADRGVYGYEDGCSESFGRAEALGIRRIYDLPIGYWRAAQTIYAEEAELQPAWRSTLGGLQDGPEKLERKERELSLASDVIVASSFTAETLEVFPGHVARTTVIPYGYPQPRAQLAPRTSTDGPLKIVYVGSLTQRKGLSYLLDAIRQLGGDAALTMVSRPELDAPLQPGADGIRWRWGLSHQQTLDEIAQSDVLVLPSLFEGFGLVLTEALSQGVPIVATTHTAAPDLIRDGEEGWIVPTRSSDAIAAALHEAHSDRSRLQHMKENAVKLAAGRTWADYEADIIAVASQQ